MSQSETNNTITLKYILITILAVVLTWLLHEFMHWLTGSLLGNKMVMTLNASYPEARNYLEQRDNILVSAAGPIITLVQAIVFYILLKKQSNKYLFPFLFTCLYMRTLAGFISLFNPNDEARVSLDLGIGVYTLPIIVAAFLFYLNYNIIKSYYFKAKFILVTTLIIMFVSSVIVLADQAFKIRIL